MLTPIIPIFSHLVTKIELTGVRVNHWMIDLTNEEDLRWFTREMFKSYLELELGIFIETITNKENSMPN